MITNSGNYGMVGALLILGIWGLFWLVLPKIRNSLFWAGLAWGHAGPLSEIWHHQDYWHPEYLVDIQFGAWSFGLEDYLFAFASAGICAWVFELLVSRSKSGPLVHISFQGFLLALFVSLLCMLGTGALTWLTNLNSIHAIMVIFLVGSLLYFIRYPHWILSALVTGLLTGIGIWLFSRGVLFSVFSGYFSTVVAHGHIIRYYAYRSSGGRDTLGYVCRAFCGAVFQVLCERGLDYKLEKIFDSIESIRIRICKRF